MYHVLRLMQVGKSSEDSLHDLGTDLLWKTGLAGLPLMTFEELGNSFLAELHLHYVEVLIPTPHLLHTDYVGMIHLGKHDFLTTQENRGLVVVLCSDFEGEPLFRSAVAAGDDDAERTSAYYTCDVVELLEGIWLFSSAYIVFVLGGVAVVVFREHLELANIVDHELFLDEFLDAFALLLFFYFFCLIVHAQTKAHLAILILSL